MTNKEKYLYKLDEIPVAHRALFVEINEVIRKAFADPGKLKRQFAGVYYVVINDELVSIDHPTREEGNNAWWNAKECSVCSKWYSDPYPTLKALKKSLGI